MAEPKKPAAPQGKPAEEALLDLAEQNLAAIAAGGIPAKRDD